LNPSVHTIEQLRAGPGAEVMPADPILESLGTRWPTEESTATTGGLGSGEWLAPTVDGSATLPGATTEAVGALEAGARATNVAPESGAGRPVVLEEQVALLETLEGVVGIAIWPPSPQVAPPAAEEEDEVEEIEHEES